MYLLKGSDNGKAANGKSLDEEIGTETPVQGRRKGERDVRRRLRQGSGTWSKQNLFTIGWAPLAARGGSCPENQESSRGDDGDTANSSKPFCLRASEKFQGERKDPRRMEFIFSRGGTTYRG